MSAATEKELSELHSKIAKVLFHKLDSADKATLLLAVEREETLPLDIREYLEEQMDASPALLTVITKFLKDNGITAVVDENKELTDLDRLLAKMRSRKQVGNVIPISDEEI